MNLHDALDHLGERPLRGGKLRCPEHADRAPSLHLYHKTNSWYCFSCGRNGDGYGLIALFTGQDVGSVLAQFNPLDRNDKQAVTKVKRRNPHEVRSSLWRQVRDMNWRFFDQLRHILEDKPLEMLLSHLEYWSNRFQELRNEVFDPDLPIVDAEALVEDFQPMLDEALEDLRFISTWKG